jgi:hypothetical protein
VALVTDGSDLGADADEPSLEDFAAAEQEEPRAGARVALRRTLMAVGVLFVVLALVLYFAVPVTYIFGHVSRIWRRPSIGIHRLPIAPEPMSSPKISV